MLLIGRAAATAGKPVEASVWFNLAAEYGVETAEKATASNALNPAQLTQAAQRIEEIRSTHLRGLSAPAPKTTARIVEAKTPAEAKPVAAPTATPAIAQPAPHPQVDGQKAQIANLEADLAAARSAAGAAKAQSDEWASNLEAALAKANQSRDTLSAEVETLRREKLSAEESLAQLRAKPALDGQVEVQTARIAALETELAAARDESRAVKAQSGEAATRLEAALAQANLEQNALSGEVTSLRQERTNAEESLAQLRARPALDGRLEAQKAQIAKLEAELAAAVTEARNAKAQAGDATTQLEAALANTTQQRDTVSAENTTLRQDRLRAEEARDQIRVELSTARSKLEADLAAARNEARIAKSQVDEASNHEAALAKATRERDALSTEVATLRQDKLRAEESLAQMSARPSLDGQVESQKAQIATLETDLASARSEARSAKEEAGQANSRLEAALAQASQQRDALSSEVTALRQEKLRAEESLAQMRAQPDLSGQVESQKSQIAKLEADLVASRSVDIATLRQDRIRAEEARDQMRAELSASRSKLETDLSAARIEARNAKAQAGDATTQLEAALANTTQQRDSLATEVAALRQEKLQADESLAQLRAQPATDGEVEALKARIAGLESDLAAARNETRTATTRSDDAATRLETALALASQELDARSGEVVTLRREKLSAEEDRDQIRAELSSARSRLETYDASVRDGALVDAASHRETLRQSELRVDMANRRLQGVEQDSERLQARLRESEAKVAAAERATRNDSAEIERLRGALASTEKARIAALASREAAITELTAAQIRNDNIVRELARARPGMVLVSDGTARAEPSRSPAPEPTAPEPRMHTVAQGETLSIISERYYKTPGRWREIFNANRDVMTTENQLVPGMKLRIP